MARLRTKLEGLFLIKKPLSFGGSEARRLWNRCKVDFFVPLLFDCLDSCLWLAPQNLIQSA